MEEIVLAHWQRQNMQTPGRKVLSSGSPKDMWVVVRDGSAIDVESALALLKKNGGNINSRNAFGLTPLHIGTWRNHIPIVKRLLAAGADPNARDGESGWNSLHRALHFGHLAMASILLQSGASMTTEDSKYRTPVDLLSGPVMQTVGNGDNNAVVTELFSWGSGVNYQLGTGNAHIQKLPCKVDSLQGSFIKLVSSAKFHSVAVTKIGEVYTWGFGRGGRLGHPDFDIHSGQAAVITPRQVTSGLGGRRVKTIAAAKHHTVAATEGGEVFTWGSNREGQLGYTSVDTQPTPRRVSSLKTRIVAVAAANKHTAVLSECGEVFTWGCNKEGQLGYGTSNSGSNYTPRLVEYLKGKVFIGVSAAKYHTIVLGADGEVFTWGHRLVTPRRVVVARNIKKSGSYPLKFHRKKRLHVVSIGAGMVHSVALTDDGALFYWVSSDPDLRCQQLHSLCGRSVVSISAGKYWIAGATSGGDVYMWDGKKRKSEPPHVTRLHGVKRATSVSVGETHILIITSLYHPPYPCQTVDNNQNLKLKVKNEVDVDELNDDFIYDDTEYDEALSIIQRDEVEKRPLPSLKSLCEKAAAEYLVEPRSALQLLEIADSLEAHDLRKHCEDIVIRNLDYILTVSSHAIANCSLDVLVDLEKSLDSRSSEAWSHRRLPPPTATFPAIINSEEEDDSETQLCRTRDKYSNKSASNRERFDSFLQPNNNETNQDICKQIRALRKKLQQIEMLEEKQSKGHLLDDQQIAKLRTRDGLERSLLELGVPIDDVSQPKSSSSVLLDGKENKRANKKQKRKNKHMLLVKGEEMHANRCFSGETNVVKGFSGETNIVKGFLQVDVSEVEHKEKHAEIEGISVGQDIREPPINTKKDPSNCKTPSPASSKKKNRKGGLSMFLSGALDDAPKDAPPPPPTPKSEGPAWGGATVSKGSASLREILQQDEKGKTKENKLSGQVEGISDVKNGAKFQDNSLLISSPIPVVSARTPQIPDGERATPPWASSGTPPHVSRPSLRGIQLQQVKKQQSLSHSPKTSTTGFCVTSGQGSPSDSSNRWFKPEVETPSSLRSIQIEEKAIKDLKRFYSTVKIVKNHS